MLKIILAAALGMGVALPALADRKEDRARELIELLQLDTQFDQIQDPIQVFSSVFAPRELPEAERAIYERYQQRMLALTRKEMGPEKIEAHMIELYSTYFTEQELVDMIEFHRTPTGQRMIETMPMIMEESMLFSQEAMMRLAPQLQAISQEMQAELQAHRRQSAEQTGIEP